MYNHARTLLMNLDGSAGYFLDLPGDELIPADYRKLVLPGALDLIRMRLFGAEPDRAFLNYRVAQLLEIIAATELQSHVLALDPRLTYGKPDIRLSDPQTYVPHISQFSGTTQLTITGTPAAPDASGQSQYAYNLTLASGSLTVERTQFPATSVTTLITLTNQLSQPIALPFSGYQVRVNSTSAARWSVRGWLRPQAALADITTSVRSIGESTLIALFGVDDVEPYRTFRNCWESHPEYAYRLGGLVLALVYRSEEVRNGE
jgi:hypothetical protein